ncbi:hypothetical protein [Photorhabdus akhurstii]|uniref:hypothetical protein n=1 Tax=Photorhabdus akhurstii TaxID=171438 RepID=UPI001BD6877D|nr:hypothetical protein [Photorhabdus akhurstii]
MDITIGLETAFAFWISKNINIAADNDDIKRVTKLVNGGENGLADRTERLSNLKNLMRI